MATEARDLISELEAIQLEIQRRKWAQDPDLWARERMGITLWSGQRNIMLSVAKHRKTAVASCHEAGKSFSAALVVCWWLDIWPVGEAFVVTSAPSGPQVKNILWREITRMQAKGGLAGRTNQTEWFMMNPDGQEEIVAFGRKPDDYDFTAFQGIHARRVLVVLDEACGIPEVLYEAADSLIANDLSKALAIGNPDDPLSHFEVICRPGSEWNVMHIGAFDTPNFTGEPIPEEIKDVLIGRMYVEEKRRKWAPAWRWVPDGTRVVPPADADPQDTHPFWQSKILGVFPKQGQEGTLIPANWIKRAQDRFRRGEYTTEGRHRLGVDVGGGGDSSTIAETTGQLVRIIHEDHNPDTMHTAGVVIGKYDSTEADELTIDMIGIGDGAYHRIREVMREREDKRGLERGTLERRIYGFKASQSPKDEEQFYNLRSELYWYTRELFEKDLIVIDPIDSDLAWELGNILFKRTSKGQVQVESKKDMIARGVQSPNRAEALMLAVFPVRPKFTKGTWGR